jgi:hypothetical protein
MHPSALSYHITSLYISIFGGYLTFHSQRLITRIISMDHLLHSISIIHFKQASKRAVQTYVEVIPRTLIVYFSKVVPRFFGIGMYYLAFFGLDWAFLGMGWDW